ncbi:MAG: hypothetical protein SGBAC_013419, partial [Bacillariaceae sp.]
MPTVDRIVQNRSLDASNEENSSHDMSLLLNLTSRSDVNQPPLPTQSQRKRASRDQQLSIDDPSDGSICERKKPRFRAYQKD